MKKANYILLGFFVLLTLFFQITLNDQELMDKWKDYKHGLLIKTVDPIAPKDRTIIRNESNLNNQGIVLEGEKFNYIVFDGLHLEKTDKALNTVDVLHSQHQGYHLSHLQLMDNWLFYTSEGIHRVNVETKDKDKLYAGGVNELYVTEDHIYFTDYKRGMSLFKMGLNGEDLACINDSLILDILYTDTGFLAVREVIDHGEIVSIDFQGNLEVLESPFAGYGILKVDDDLYYRDKETYALMKMNLTTLAKEVLVHEAINYFAIDQGTIYYTLKDESSEFGDALGLCKLTEDGQTIVLDDETLMSTGMVNILDDFIVYESDYKSNPFGNTFMTTDGKERLVIHRGND